MVNLSEEPPRLSGPGSPLRFVRDDDKGVFALEKVVLFNIVAFGDSATGFAASDT
ncbi:hypothetical protein [uncultured Roseibium sp.]|uniref:hypothetical protein n=1 Tax=uncultured Roseibium sp. TaxID=1936171 RepID=UPI00261E8D53|nr:hypothetical protein [uncultured Roseibium sp.]